MSANSAVWSNAKTPPSASLSPSSTPRAPKSEAASAGFYDSKAWGTKHARVQVLSIKELLNGRSIGMPATRDFRTFKKAPKAKEREITAPDLFKK